MSSPTSRLWPLLPHGLGVIPPPKNSPNPNAHIHNMPTHFLAWQMPAEYLEMAAIVFWCFCWIVKSSKKTNHNYILKFIFLKSRQFIKSFLYKIIFITLVGIRWYLLYSLQSKLFTAMQHGLEPWNLNHSFIHVLKSTQIPFWGMHWAWEKGRDQESHSKQSQGSDGWQWEGLTVRYI